MTHRLDCELFGETDAQAIERYLKTPWEDVHPGVWTALCVIAVDWYDEAQRLAERLERLKEQWNWLADAVEEFGLEVSYGPEGSRSLRSHQKGQID